MTGLGRRRRAHLVVTILGVAAVGPACSGDGLAVGSAWRALTVSDCPAGSNVIEGTSGDDVLRGTNGADCILGYGGNDRLFGRKGDDFLVGGDGDDVISGDAGYDRLYGEAGEDLLLGGPDDDFLAGGDDSDVLDGERGADVAVGDDGNDAIAPGVEIADGGDGFDLCVGTRCESGAYRTCRDDGDCVPDGRCLHGKACVSCIGEPLCEGTLVVTIDVEEGCDAGFAPDKKGVCMDVDECAEGLDACGPGTVCVNDVGAYRCDVAP